MSPLRLHSWYCASSNSLSVLDTALMPVRNLLLRATLAAYTSSYSLARLSFCERVSQGLTAVAPGTYLAAHHLLEWHVVVGEVLLARALRVVQTTWLAGTGRT